MNVEEDDAGGDPEDDGRSDDSVGNSTTRADITRANRDADAMVVGRAKLVALSVHVVSSAARSQFSSHSSCAGFVVGDGLAFWYEDMVSTTSLCCSDEDDICISPVC